MIRWHLVLLSGLLLSIHVYGYTFNIEKKTSLYPVCSWMWAGRDSNIEVVITPKTTQNVFAFVFDSKRLQTLTKPESAWRGASDSNRATSQLQSKDGSDKWIRPILSPDFYCVSIVASGTDGGMELENRVYGYIQFNNEFEGHLPANEYPKLYLYATCTGILFIITATWITLCFHSQKKLHFLQHLLTVTAVLFLAQMYFQWKFYSYMNNHPIDISQLVSVYDDNNITATVQRLGMYFSFLKRVKDIMIITCLFLMPASEPTFYINARNIACVSFSLMQGISTFIDTYNLTVLGSENNTRYHITLIMQFLSCSLSMLSASFENSNRQGTRKKRIKSTNYFHICLLVGGWSCFLILRQVILSQASLAFARIPAKILWPYLWMLTDFIPLVFGISSFIVFMFVLFPRYLYAIQLPDEAGFNLATNKDHSEEKISETNLSSARN